MELLTGVKGAADLTLAGMAVLEPRDTDVADDPEVLSVNEVEEGCWGVRTGR